MSDDINILKEVISLGKEVKGLSVKMEEASEKTRTLFDFHNDRVKNSTKLMSDIKVKIDSLACPREKDIDETIQLVKEHQEELKNIIMKRPWREDLIKNFKTIMAIIAGMLGITWALKRFNLW